MNPPIRIDPNELARRLGIARSRLTMEIVQQPPLGQAGMVVFNLYVDGKDLSPAQEKIANQFLSEKTGFQTGTLKSAKA